MTTGSRDRTSTRGGRTERGGGRNGRGRQEEEKLNFSFDTDDADEGLIDDFEGTFVDWYYDFFKYESKDPRAPEYPEKPSLMLVISVDDPPGDNMTQPYGLGGSVDSWEFDDEGKDILAAPKQHLTKTSGAGRLMQSLRELGIGDSIVKGTDFGWLMGYKTHLKRSQSRSNNGDDGGNTALLLPVQLISRPRSSSSTKRGSDTKTEAKTERAAASTKSSRGSGGKSTRASKSSNELTDEIVEATLIVLEAEGVTASGGEISVDALKVAIAGYHEPPYDTEDSRTVLFTASRPELLDKMAEAGHFVVDGDVVFIEEGDGNGDGDGDEDEDE